MAEETDNPFEIVLDRLREKGWQKGDFGPSEGPNCIYGAITAVEVNFHAVDASVVKIVGEQFSDRTLLKEHKGVAFNDHPDTTFTDVERVLEKAAVKWEEERVLRDD